MSTLKTVFFRGKDYKHIIFFFLLKSFLHYMWEIKLSKFEYIEIWEVSAGKVVAT